MWPCPRRRDVVARAGDGWDACEALTAPRWRGAANAAGEADAVGVRDARGGAAGSGAADPADASVESAEGDSTASTLPVAPIHTAGTDWTWTWPQGCQLELLILKPQTGKEVKGWENLFRAFCGTIYVHHLLGGLTRREKKKFSVLPAAVNTDCVQNHVPVHKRWRKDVWMREVTARRRLARENPGSLSAAGETDIPSPDMQMFKDRTRGLFAATNVQDMESRHLH